MNSLLYIIAGILLVGWALGVFIFAANGIIHILLVIAIIALVLGIIRRAVLVLVASDSTSIHTRVSKYLNVIIHSIPHLICLPSELSCIPQLKLFRTGHLFRYDLTYL